MNALTRLVPRSGPGTGSGPGQPQGDASRSGTLSFYDHALDALAKAVRVDEAKDIHDHAERLRFVARQARNKQALADASELMLRAERRLGELIGVAKAHGQLREGRPRKGENGSGSEQFPAVSLADAGIDRKLSSSSQKLAAYDPARFDAYIADARSKILGGRAIVVNPVKDLNTEDKALRRRIREAQLAARQKALPDRKYGVICADPEWRFETYGPGGMDRSADNHYPTSATAVIAARPVGDLAADDCVLFLWATVPMLPEALAVMAAWGFAYKSHWVWDKVSEGTGYWNRNKHELLLVGTRGGAIAPAPGTQRPSIMVERATAHSTKPEWAYAMIEEFYPNLAKIELNARVLRPGWDAWGYEAPEESSAPRSGEDANRLGDPEAPSPVRPASVPADLSPTGRGENEIERGQGTAGGSVEGPERDPAQADAGDLIDPDGVESALAAGAQAAIPAAPADPSSSWDIDSLASAPSQSGATPGAGGLVPSDQSSLVEPGSPVFTREQDAYATAVRAAVSLRGRHSRATAEPVVRAAYACEPIVPTRQLAADLGHPEGTVLGWAFKLGLTRHERLRESARRATAQQHQARELSP